MLKLQLAGRFNVLRRHFDGVCCAGKNRAKSDSYGQDIDDLLEDSPGGWCEEACGRGDHRGQ